MKEIRFDDLPDINFFGVPECFRVLGLTPPCTVKQVRTAFREQARKHHPDHGGDPEAFRRLVSHYEAAVKLVEATVAHVPEPEKKAKPRSRGRIYQQPGTTRWTIQYYMNGKIVREATGSADYRVAQQKLTQRLASMDKGEVVPVRVKPILISGSIAVSVGKRAMEKDASWKSPKARLSHCA
jgi:hypothetical protein